MARCSSGCWGRSKSSTTGSPSAVGGTKLSTLLAVLLVRANEVVPVDRLIEDLWEEEPPENATATLHSYVSQLRSALGRGEPERLITRKPGYLLRVAPDELDATRFESLVSEGRRVLAEGDAEVAADLLAEASALWRGDVLAEFGDATFARGEVVRLSAVRDQAAEDRMEAELQLGRDAELVPELERLIDEQPLRERRWAQLMLALYRVKPPSRRLTEVPGAAPPPRRRVGHRPEQRAGASRGRNPAPAAGAAGAAEDSAPCRHPPAVDTGRIARQLRRLAGGRRRSSRQPVRGSGERARASPRVRRSDRPGPPWVRAPVTGEPGIGKTASSRPRSPTRCRCA